MKMKNNHRELYPQQYNHPLCGKTVRTKSGESFVVFRVVNSSFGQLAMSEENQNPQIAFAIRDLEVQQQTRLLIAKTEGNSK